MYLTDVSGGQVLLGDILGEYFSPMGARSKVPDPSAQINFLPKFRTREESKELGPANYSYGHRCLLLVLDLQ